MNLKYMSSSAFKKQKNRKREIAKFVSAEVQTEGLGPRQAKFILSTESVDRDGDIVQQSGWQLDNYLKNPVVLFQHDNEAFPIGKCVAIGIEDGMLVGTVQFVDADVPCAGDPAEACWRLAQEGYLNAVSVGFKVLDWDFSDDEDNPHGAIFSKMELLEWSIVTIPANPEALILPTEPVEAPAPSQPPSGGQQLVEAAVEDSEEPKSAAAPMVKDLRAQMMRRIRIAQLNTKD